MEERGKRHYALYQRYALIKDTFMHNHILYHARKHFCCYCLQAFSIEEILKHITDCFKVNDETKDFNA